MIAGWILIFDVLATTLLIVVLNVITNWDEGAYGFIGIVAFIVFYFVIFIKIDKYTSEKTKEWLDETGLKAFVIFLVCLSIAGCLLDSGKGGRKEVPPAEYQYWIW